MYRCHKEPDTQAAIVSRSQEAGKGHDCVSYALQLILPSTHLASHPVTASIPRGAVPRRAVPQTGISTKVYLLPSQTSRCRPNNMTWHTCKHMQHPNVATGRLNILIQAAAAQNNQSRNN